MERARNVYICFVNLEKNNTRFHEESFRDF